MPDEMLKEKLMLILQMRGRCTEFEYKLKLFENAVKGQGSMFKSMMVALESMDKELHFWVDAMDGLIKEWRVLHETK